MLRLSQIEPVEASSNQDTTSLVFEHLLALWCEIFQSHLIFFSVLDLERTTSPKESWFLSVWNGISVNTVSALGMLIAATAKSLQSCPTLCNPIDGSPPGSPVPGILQARTLELVAISFSSEWKRKVKVKSLSRVWLLVIPLTAAYQAPPSMGFSRQEYWSGLPLPSPLTKQKRQENERWASKPGQIAGLPLWSSS